MRKFVNVDELRTDNILTVAEKCEYEVCVEEVNGYVVLQDAGCLEALLSDGGAEFI